MQQFAAFVAASAATGFAVELYLGWRHRPRPHAAAWTAALAAFAAATWALAVGLTIGWGSLTFRVFYYLGAIANIPLLAAGSVYLVLGPKAGRRFAYAVGGWLLLGLLAVLAAPLVADVPASQLPKGSELYDFTFRLGGVGLPGPRIFAVFSGAVGTVVVVGLALYSAVRFLRSSPRLAGGNGLIVLGTLAPAFGGTLTALGEGGGLAVSLLIGAALLWAGYRVASSAPRPERPVPSSAEEPAA